MLTYIKKFKYIVSCTKNNIFNKIYTYDLYNPQCKKYIKKIIINYIILIIIFFIVVSGIREEKKNRKKGIFIFLLRQKGEYIKLWICKKSICRYTKNSSQINNKNNNPIHRGV